MAIDVEHLLILVDLQAVHGDQKRRVSVHAVEGRLGERAQALLTLAEVLIHAGGAQLVVTLDGFFGRLDIDALHLGQKLIDGVSREDGALLDELLNLLGVMQGRAEVLADHHAHGRAVRLPLAVPEHSLHMAGLDVVGAAHEGVGRLLVAEALTQIVQVQPRLTRQRNGGHVLQALDTLIEVHRAVGRCSPKRPRKWAASPSP